MGNCVIHQKTTATCTQPQQTSSYWAVAAPDCALPSLPPNTTRACPSPWSPRSFPCARTPSWPKGAPPASSATTTASTTNFDDTVSGGDWLCEQNVVEYFVQHCTEEMVQLEQWGCPWSRKDDGSINVRYFGGMKTPRTWFAADRSGFHILHTLFQTSLKYPQIRRYDEFFCTDLLVEDGHIRGLLAVEIASGERLALYANAVVMTTGGAGRVFRQNTNAGTLTGDGMGMAFRAGVPLRDMEFVQYHPTCLPGSGILMTEGCRGEGGILVNSDGYRYLQDYGLGPLDPWPRPKAMELGPRDRLSQAFWHEKQKGRTIDTPHGAAVHLDLRHLGEKKIHERLPLIAEAAETFAGVDPVKSPIPVCPAVHYTMGGILTDGQCETPIKGLFAAGECSSVGIHGANRLGSNSLAELLVFGRVAGEGAAREAERLGRTPPSPAVQVQAEEAERRILSLLDPARSQQPQAERPAVIRDEMRASMEDGVASTATKRACRPPATSWPNCASAIVTSSSRLQPCLQHRLADHTGAGLFAGSGAGHGPFGPGTPGVAWCPPAAGRIHRTG